MPVVQVAKSNVTCDGQNPSSIISKQRCRWRLLIESIWKKSTF